MDSYLDPTEYKSGAIPVEELYDRLCEASRAIDGLTFNRIVAVGFEKLTPNQQGLIKRAVAKQADFCYQNAELIESPLNSYSISGVSMSFDRSKVMQLGGVTTTAEVYSLLLQTGLAYRGVI
ncbi:MAG: hypothetical protein IJM75_06285 [Ruminococcus sp.]|nr:hypothetical protein [Ruminococcus sp.]